MAWDPWLSCYYASRTSPHHLPAVPRGSNWPCGAWAYWLDSQGPGIDLIYQGKGGELKYEFIVKPGADPGQIRLAYRGIEGMSVTDAGDLILKTAAGEMRDGRPVVYQEIGGKRMEVEAGFRLLPAGPEGFIQGFTVKEYDPGYPLILDPGLDYVTFLGGGGDDWGLKIAADASGGIYVTGGTESLDFPPTVGAFDTSYNVYYNDSDNDNDYYNNYGRTDAFVAKLSADGSTLLYSTFLGGYFWDRGSGIALGASGNAYLTGYTRSADFPVTPGAPGVDGNSPGGTFVARLSADGSTLLAIILAGGESEGIALDAAGNAYVAGWTRFSNFPTNTPGVSDAVDNGSQDAFVARFSPGLQILDVSPSSFGFGVVNVRSSSAPNRFAITNLGDGDLVIGTIVLTGDDAGQFGLRNDTCSGRMVGALGSCTFEALFSPTSMGAKGAALAIPSNDPDHPTLNVALSGTGLNNAPVANDQLISMYEDTAKKVILTATDANGYNLAYSIVTQPAHGTLSGTPPNVRYVPNPDYFGNDSFTFRANDGTVDSNVATVSISVAPAYAVSGFILDSNKAAISGVTVEARDLQGALVATALTDDQGGYRLNLPPINKYTLIPIKETHVFRPVSKKVTIKNKDVTGKQNFTCRDFQIKGQVRDERNKPLAGVTVNLKQGDSIVAAQAITDAKGNYSFSFYNAGPYTVEPVQDGIGFNPQSIEVVITMKNKSNVNFIANVDVDAPSRGKLTGERQGCDAWSFGIGGEDLSRTQSSMQFEYNSLGQVSITT